MLIINSSYKLAQPTIADLQSVPITPQNIFKILWFSNIEGIAQIMFDISVPFNEDHTTENGDRYCEALGRFAEQIEKALESAVCQDFVRTYLEYKDKAG